MYSRRGLAINFGGYCLGAVGHGGEKVDEDGGDGEEEGADYQRNQERRGKPARRSRAKRACLRQACRQGGECWERLDSRVDKASRSGITVVGVRTEQNQPWSGRGGWWVVCRAVVVAVAFAVIAFIYWMGLPDVSGALILSGLLVLLAFYFRSGALAPVYLQPRHFRTLRNSARWEFSKAMLCAGLGLDIVRLIIIADDRLFILNYSIVTRAAVFALVAVWLLGTGAFLARSFAAYILSLRP